jgi:hypothetical protein
MATKPTEAKGGFTMYHTTFMINVFCLIDDWLKGKCLRQRGPQPKLADSEVLTIEIVGAFLGINTDKGIYTYFRRHYGDWLPMLREVHRTTFVRQSANLWAVKDQFWLYTSEYPLRFCDFASGHLSGSRILLRSGLSLSVNEGGWHPLVMTKWLDKPSMASERTCGYAGRM